jgi:hypothetical protein
VGVDLSPPPRELYDAPEHEQINQKGSACRSEGALINTAVNLDYQLDHGARRVGVVSPGPGS